MVTAFKQRFFLFLCLVCLVVTEGQANSREVNIPDKTPTDVYRLVLQLEQQVRSLRADNSVLDDWPQVAIDSVEHPRSPRHVLQKSIEVLEKLNRLRQIRGQGAITIPPYPSRYITPNEVYDAVSRLVEEVAVLSGSGRQARAAAERFVGGSRYTPTDVYGKLWEISQALDPLLGIRGFSPNDVYSQAKYVVDLVRFLRLSQNLPDTVPAPERQPNLHPNHALGAAYQLLARISKAERNLWMQPEPVPVVPRRVIRPTEVFDALQIVIAELKRIKFRLGVERNIPLPALESGKSPSDVVQLLNWAQAAMPQFELQRPLFQYDQSGLSRKPADVMNVANQIDQGLRIYQQARGIRMASQQAPITPSLAPKHVYQKTLGNLDKVARLRQQVGLGATVVPPYPMRSITPNEVYELAIRLRDELNLIYDTGGITPASQVALLTDADASQVTPSDVYRQMWNISYRLDTILGPTGYSLQDLYTQTRLINDELMLLAQHLERLKPLELPATPVSVTPDLVLDAAEQLLDLTERAQQRAGLAGGQIPRPAISGRITTGDLFNTVGVIRTELATLKLQLGVIQLTRRMAPPEKVSLVDVYQQLVHGQQLLRQCLLEETVDASSLHVAD